MNFVANHVLKPLIVGRIKEDHDFHPLSSEAIVHDLVAVALVAQIVQLVRDVLHCLALERSRIAFISIQTGHFTKDGLNQVTDSHT